MDDLRILQQFESEWERTLSESSKEQMRQFIQRLKERVIKNNNSLSGIEIIWPDDFPREDSFFLDFLEKVMGQTNIDSTSNGFSIKFN